MFRDFIYLDTDRIQSIIAQLQQGLLDQLMEGETKEKSKTAGATLSFLSMLVPFGASASLERRSTTDIQKNKILHDYAFNMALDSLEEKGYLLKADDLELDTSSIPESAFVLVKGSVKIFDYATFQNLAKHEKDLNKLFPSEQPTGSRDQRRRSGTKKNNSLFGELKILVDAFFEDSIQITVTNAQGISFIGPVNREHLREDIRNLIFKFGSKPQGEWGMLAQITRTLSSQRAASLQLETSVVELEELPAEDIQTASSVLNEVLDAMNSFQEFMGSAAYPDVSVSPIAVYRETMPLHREAEA